MQAEQQTLFTSAETTAKLPTLRRYPILFDDETDDRMWGDILDLATLAAAYNDDNPKKGNVGLAIAAVAGITIVDALAGQSIRSLHSRKGEPVRDYSDRSGFPKGIGYSQGKASGRVPQDYHATPAAAAASPTTGKTSPASADLILEVSA